MPAEPRPRRRKPLRLPKYDYSSEGGYFITIMTHKRIPIFGRILDNQIAMSNAGIFARSEWFRTQQLRENVELFEEEFVVMPNHVHGIIWLTRSRGTARCAPTMDEFPSLEQYGKPVSGSIPTIIRAYKSVVTYAINISRNTPGQPVWQRNYYEHIIRDEKDYENIFEYIYQNPRNWDKDEEYRNQ